MTSDLRPMTYDFRLMTYDQYFLPLRSHRRFATQRKPKTLVSTEISSPYLLASSSVSSVPSVVNQSFKSLLAPLRSQRHCAAQRTDKLIKNKVLGRGSLNYKNPTPDIKFLASNLAFGYDFRPTTYNLRPMSC